ncbi:MAG: DUF1028 domain-containing protein [Candidatus Latescibacteria bacterium]|nr:DUF1028 domain-containing protein [Candidatus Latescibacterota bacterium]
MQQAFSGSDESLADRLMATLHAGKSVGADSRCQEFGFSSFSAAMIVAEPQDSIGRPKLHLGFEFDIDVSLSIPRNGGGLTMTTTGWTGDEIDPLAFARPSIDAKAARDCR